MEEGAQHPVDAGLIHDISFTAVARRESNGKTQAFQACDAGSTPARRTFNRLYGGWFGSGSSPDSLVYPWTARQAGRFASIFQRTLAQTAPLPGCPLISSAR